MAKSKEQALFEFWSSFGIPTFEENTVPDDWMKEPEPYPYLTYNAPTDRLGNVIPIHCDLWYRSSSALDVIEKKNEILKRVLEHGFVTVPFDGGYIYIMEGTPLAQPIDDDDPAIQRYYINLSAEYLCEY